MDASKGTTVTPIQRTQLSTFAGESGWMLCDIAVDSTRAVVSGYSNETEMTTINLLTLNRSNSQSLQQQAVYSMKSSPTTSHLRYVSLTDDSSLIVSVCDSQLDLYNVNTGERVNTSTMDGGRAGCMTVGRREIFIGSHVSNEVTVFDLNLNKINTITLKGIEAGDFPEDITLHEDNLFISTSQGKAVKYDMEGIILHKYETPDQSTYARSITLSSQIGLVFVSWGNHRHVVAYSLSEGLALFSFPVVDDLVRIRINNVNRLFTASREGELCVYSTTSIFTYNHLKDKLSSSFTRNDCEKLGDYFSFPSDQVQTITNSQHYSARILHALEERGYMHRTDVSRLNDALVELKINKDHLLTETYTKLIAPARASEYERFLGILSTHLTLSITEKLCDYFKFADVKKESITSSQMPGLSFLINLDEMGIIGRSEVRELEMPLKEYGLLQAVAMIHEYQCLATLDKTELHTDLSDEEKLKLFIRCLKQKIRSLFETTSPLPWKKSCQWKSDDLFIATELVVTNTFLKMPNKINTDPISKIHYRDIFTDERLKSERRFILEGQPGSGKTMLSLKLAYDWSCGRVKDVPILIFLPLKIVGDMTVVQAIRKFYIRDDIPIVEDDIESILSDDKNTTYMILDGLEEYNGRGKDGKPSEVVRVMKKKKLSKCTVLLTARSDYVKDLPPGQILQLGGFGVDEVNKYIKKVYLNDTRRQEEVKEVMKNKVPFVINLCSIPLLFAMSVHNIDSIAKLQEGQLNRVTPFVKAIIDILCPDDSQSYISLQQQQENAGTTTTMGRHSVPGSMSGNIEEGSSVDRQMDMDFGCDESDESKAFPGCYQETMSLEELAFNGLCRGNPQLLWQKDFVDRYVTNSRAWIDAGILVVEEGTPTSTTGGGSLQADSASGSMQTDSVSGILETDSASGILETDSTSGSMQTDSTSGNMQTDSVSDEYQKTPDDTSGKEIEEAIEACILSSTKPFESKRKVGSKATKTISSGHWSVVKDVSLQVKYLHKFIQEWFAANYLAFLFWGCKSSEEKNELFKKHLANIDPTDLQYVLCFTCHICPPSFHFIASFLMTGFKTKDDEIPVHIMNCIFLCFSEYDGEGGGKVNDIVEDVCLKEVITMSLEDSRLLLKSKIAMLNFASKSKIDIKHLKLTDVVETVTDKALVLESDIWLGVLDTLVTIEVNRWDRKLKATEYEDLIRYIANCKSIKSARLFFPTVPEIVTDAKVLKVLQSRNVSVEWMIGENLTYTLDLKTGTWMMEFRQDGGTIDKRILEYMDKEKHPGVKTWVDVTGGIVQIPGTDVILRIPPGALAKSCLIEMQIVPNPSQEWTASSFTSSATVVIEMLPRNMTLLKPVELTLPHCLQLPKIDECRVLVYSSYHPKGTRPRWQPKPNADCKLNDTNCVIWLDRFCWETYEIEGKSIDGKRLRAYAACKEFLRPNLVHIEAGYFLDLPGLKETMLKKYLHWLGDTLFVFVKEGSLPFEMILRKMSSTSWTCNEDKCKKKVPYINIAVGMEYSTCPYIFTKDGEEDCFCYLDFIQHETVEVVFPIMNLPKLAENRSSAQAIAGEFTQVTRGGNQEKPPLKEPVTSESEGTSTASSSSTKSVKEETSRKQKTKDDKRRTSKLVENLIDLKVDDKILKDLSGKFNKEWWNVGRNLKLKETKLYSIEADHIKKGREEVVYQMLLKWRGKNGKKATNRVLGEALRAAGRKDLQEHILEMLQ